MDLKELYAQFGELMIQQEILNSKISNCRKAIVEEINKKSVVPPTPPKD